MSDIHGNNPAFVAAIEDAKLSGADEYILLGDYTSRYPWGDMVVDTMRSLCGAHVIRGNGEGYYVNWPPDWGDMSAQQLAPITWAYEKLTRDNLAYLLALPETAMVSHGGIDIFLQHSIDFFFHPQVMTFAHTMNFNNMMLVSPLSHYEHLVRGREAFLACPAVVAAIMALPKGVYLYGHNHLQFHMEYEGRLFINPGSCGMAADWGSSAAYTLLTIEDGKWSILERRVVYDIDAAEAGFVSTGYQAYAPVWSDATIRQMRTGMEYFGWLVTHLNKTRQDAARMIATEKIATMKAATPEDVWDIAIKTWPKEISRIQSAIK